MVILTFLYIFNFNLIKNYSISESSILVFIFLIVELCRRDNYNIYFRKVIFSKYVKSILLILFSLIVLSILWPTFLGSYDYSYGKVLIHQMFIITVGIMLACYIKIKRRSILEAIIYSFVLQASIQFLSFLSPTFLQITDIFRSSALILQRSMNYEGYRGLAISGSNFFGLAVGYSIVLIIIRFYWKEWNLSVSQKLLFVALLTFGSLSAGRSSIIGILILYSYLIVLLFKDIRNRSKVNQFIFFSLITIVVILLFIPFISQFLESSNSWQNMKYYLFQFLYNDDNSLNDAGYTSLDHLFNDMYFELNNYQLMIGDGKYTNPNGTYYLLTDVGFMRNILFMGIFWTLYLYLYQIIFLFYNVKSNRSIKLASVIFTVLVIYELKGQTIGFLLMSQSVLILLTSIKYQIE